MLYMPSASRIVLKVQLMTCFVTLLVCFVQLPPMIKPYLPVHREEQVIVQPIVQYTFDGFSEHRLIEPHR